MKLKNKIVIAFFALTLSFTVNGFYDNSSTGFAGFTVVSKDSKIEIRVQVLNDLPYIAKDRWNRGLLPSFKFTFVDDFKDKWNRGW